MKLTRIELRKIIREAMDPIKVRTVNIEDYDPPAGLASVSLGKPRDTETPIMRVGNFFASALPYKPPRGYSSLKKKKYFYMVLPDGSSIRIDQPDVIINKRNLVKQYLTILDNNVTPLPLGDLNSPTPEDLANIKTMQREVRSAIEIFKQTQSN
jgi:hypothetical protein